MYCSISYVLSFFYGNTFFQRFEFKTHAFSNEQLFGCNNSLVPVDFADFSS